MFKKTDENKVREVLNLIDDQADKPPHKQLLQKEIARLTGVSQPVVWRIAHEYRPKHKWGGHHRKRGDYKMENQYISGLSPEQENGRRCVGCTIILSKVWGKPTACRDCTNRKDYERYPVDYNV